jgi:hypothetical protein
MDCSVGEGNHMRLIVIIKTSTYISLRQGWHVHAGGFYLFNFVFVFAITRREIFAKINSESIKLKTKYRNNFPCYYLQLIEYYQETIPKGGVSLQNI